MRLVATEYLSVDGVFEEPGLWSGPFFGADAGQFKWDELQASDAMLLGRKTYEGFAAAWPNYSDEVGFADRMNTMPKYVVSATLDKADWPGSELIKDDPIARIRELKQRPGRDLLLAGSGQLFNALRTENLIDVYRLMVHPIVLGSGPRLFSDGKTVLALAGTRTLSTGIIINEYTPAAADPPA